MAKTPAKAPIRPDPDDSPQPSDMDVLPGETLEEWNKRKNTEEGVGPDGRYTYESRHPTKWDEHTDPHLGQN